MDFDGNVNLISRTHVRREYTLCQKVAQAQILALTSSITVLLST